MAVSELQLALIGAGGVAVVGVWVYNRWQEYRHSKVAKAIFASEQEDVLTREPAVTGQAIDTSKPAARLEPVFSLPQDEISEEFAAKEFDDDPTVDEQGVSAVTADAAALVASVSDELIDSMIEVSFALPSTESAETLRLGWKRGAPAGFSKRVRWVACESSTGQWVELADNLEAAGYRAHVAIQLADRQGAISDDELNTFYRTAISLAEQFGGGTGVSALPAASEVLAHAHAIDDLCASVDIQIAIHIVSRTGQAFAGTKLRGMLEGSGLQLAPDGLFYLLDGEGRRLMSVCNSGAVPFDVEKMRTETVPDITFWLDVPRVEDGARVFDTMVATARQLAEALDGILVDDQRNPLADNVLATIRAKVAELQVRMAAQGIPAGGRRALRLFA